MTLFEELTEIVGFLLFGGALLAFYVGVVVGVFKEVTYKGKDQ